VIVTLRQALGNDARRVHELVDRLLDSEDSLIVLIDDRRAISFAEGFGFSPCQLELVTAEIERGVRAMAGTVRTTNNERRRRRESKQHRGPCVGIATRAGSRPRVATSARR
jgi:hypothetical protein